LNGHHSAYHALIDTKRFRNVLALCAQYDQLQDPQAPEVF
jgi:hypothetical protein